MEITQYQYTLIAPPATSSVSATLREFGKPSCKIKRKAMMEMVFNSVIKDETIMVDSLGEGKHLVHRIHVLNRSDVNFLKQEMGWVQDNEKESEG